MKLFDVHVINGRFAVWAPFGLEDAPNRRMVAAILRKIANEFDPYRTEGQQTEGSESDG